MLPKKGELISGDFWLVSTHGQHILVAVLDGLGHGEEARRISETAVDLLQTLKWQPLENLISSCHTALRQTRGLVMSLALFDSSDHTITWAGVGNVEGIVFKGESNQIEHLFQAKGIIGYKLPDLKIHQMNISAGDRLVFVTDGVKPGFERKVKCSKTPEQIVEYVVRNHIDRTDDALVFAGKFLG